LHFSKSAPSSFFCAFGGSFVSVFCCVDPSLMADLQKPGMVQKLMALMQNPSQVAGRFHFEDTIFRFLVFCWLALWECISRFASLFSFCCLPTCAVFVSVAVC
jgi:hypothetical protein